MQVRRGTPPTHVERSVVCELERDEVLKIIVSYIKEKMNNGALKIDQIEVVGSPDGHLESMTLTGVEMISLAWSPDQATGPSSVKPVVAPPVQPPIPANVLAHVPSNLPAPVQPPVKK